ncbi:MAG TPA: sigma 54-interacting transcriptional regulator, partial [Candidatus Binataceae bacterium]|nr:sigma 54-interacting transcriptional regulator [Candidatus Binataceae bacterium]
MKHGIEVGKSATHPSLIRRGQPRYFHLLWEEDIDELRPVLEAIKERRAEVVERWYHLYVLHFGDSRTLSEPEFRNIFEDALARNQDDLLRHDMDAYAADLHRLGEILAAHHVSLQEIIASLHLFEEAAQSVFPDDLKDPAWVYTTFDRLSHIRIILLTDSYVRSQAAMAGARLQALEREASKVAPEQRERFHGIVGGSPAMRELYRRIHAAAQTRGTVLIVGESGTGKELVARAIHEAGPNPHAPFVALNCAALPKDLIESELFGYKRGAFSGANTEYLGLFRAAEGGTLFLDEITEMSAETQSKLLRALQERKVRPVGATAEVSIDARMIASTNRDPEEAVRKGFLRQDLYYRLQAAVLRMPPLRERLDDLKPLAEHFIDFFNEKFPRKVPVVGLDERALEAMCGYSWPGNVRELSNAIEGAFTFGSSGTIRCEDLPPNVTGLKPAKNPPAAELSESPNLASYSDAERDLIVRALQMA